MKNINRGKDKRQLQETGAVSNYYALMSSSYRFKFKKINY